MQLRVERSYEALIFNLFARVPLVREEGDPSFASWLSLADRATRELTDRHLGSFFAELEADLPVLASLAARFDEPYRALHLVHLHERLSECAKTALSPLEEITGDRAALAPLLLARREYVDLLRTHAAIVARPFGKMFSTLLFPDLDRERRLLLPRLEELAARLPMLRSMPVVLGHSLGSRARIIGGTLYVGAKAPWNEMTSERTLALVIHECFVVTAQRVVGEVDSSPRATWARAERIAIEAASEDFRGSELGDAYRALAETRNVPGIASKDDLKREVARVLAQFRS